MLSCFSSINSYFDQWHVRKQGLKMTHSSMVKENQNNCQRTNCRTSHLLRICLYSYYVCFWSIISLVTIWLWQVALTGPKFVFNCLHICIWFGYMHLISVNAYKRTVCVCICVWYLFIYLGIVCLLCRKIFTEDLTVERLREPKTKYFKKVSKFRSMCIKVWDLHF